MSIGIMSCVINSNNKVNSDDALWITAAHGTSRGLFRPVVFTRHRKEMKMAKVFWIIVMATMLSTTHSNAQPAAPINIGSRLELFVDDYLVDRMEADAALHLHKPSGKEVVLSMDKPWEDTTMGYFAVFLDGDTYRMYYRGHHHGGGPKPRGEPMCYAESK